MEEKVFYYTFKKFGTWTVLNIVLCAMLACVLFRFPCMIFCPPTQILLVLFVVSLTGWFWRTFAKHRLAVVTDDYIKIDSCAPLYWKDVETAEEREVFCCLKKRKIIVLVPKDGTDYRYNFLQKHNGPFTPFSIPLYGIVSNADVQALSEIVEQKVGLKKL